jgi:DNA-binding response OmpR family regulator
MSPIRVLVVDDYKDWRNLVRSLLAIRPEWEIVCEASDGLEAVLKAEELKPDLILLDIGLPKLNGIEAARRIRKLVPESKILILSQERDADVAQEVIGGLGVSGYVVKAWARTELLAAVEAVLQGKQFVSSGLEDRDPLPEGVRSNLSFCFEFDTENRIFRTRFHGQVTDESVRHCYQVWETVASRADANALRGAIADFSDATSFHVTRDTIRELAALQPADPIFSRIRVIVAPNTAVFVLAQMFQMLGKGTRPNVRVVRNRPQAFALLGVTRPHFEPFKPKFPI